VSHWNQRFASSKRKLISERDDIVITGGRQVEGLQTAKQMARFPAGKARRNNRGRKTSHPFIAQADRIAKLPESPRRFEQILR